MLLVTNFLESFYSSIDGKIFGQFPQAAFPEPADQIIILKHLPKFVWYSKFNTFDFRLDFINAVRSMLICLTPAEGFTTSRSSTIRPPSFAKACNSFWETATSSTRSSLVLCNTPID
jgi:hypothetical protein